MEDQLPSRIFSEDDIGVGGRALINADFERLVVLPDVRVVTTANPGAVPPELLAALAVYLSVDASVTILGHVSSVGVGLRIGVVGASDVVATRVLIGQEGEVLSYDRDLGGIMDDGFGSQIRNYGLIAGPRFGMVLDNGGTTFTTRVINHGTIDGGDVGILGGGDLNKLVTIRNYGTITGETEAINLSTNGRAIVLRNDGTLLGDVRLGTGADTYDGRGGRVEGTVFGNNGDDVFRPGAEEEVLNGGNGIDTLNFAGNRAVSVSLLNDRPNTGPALNDTYIAIENVIGSNGADTIVGNDVGNALTGGAGNDVVVGNGGNDVINGQAGRDTVTGGAGSDQFMFALRTDGDDTITDFANVTNNNDSILVKASEFGLAAAGAIAAGAFVARADNVAQDADDRFIFRTTDRTLWADVDGSGSAGPVLLATFQGSTAVTAADILGF